MQKYLVALSVVAYLFVVPMVAGAAGLVAACGGDGQPACQACYVVELVNNVVSWLVMILGIIAAILIVVAGARLVTSGGNSSAKEAAKSSMTNLIIGYIIVLSAWLVMDYGLRALLVQGGDARFGIWNQISCIDQPVSNTVPVTQQEAVYIPIDAAIGNLQGWTYVGGGTPGGSGGGGSDSGGAGGGTPGTWTAPCRAIPAGPGGQTTYSCVTQQTQCTNNGGIPTLNAARSVVTCTQQLVTRGGAGGTCSILNSGPCSVSNLRQYFGARAEDASRICNKESGGNAVLSGSDICCGPNAQCSGAPSFSGGYFQINIISEASKIPGCNLSAFFQRNGSNSLQGNCVRRNGRGICTGWSCSITRNSAYNVCMQGALNSSSNFRIAKILFDSRGFQPWSNSRNICSIR